MNTIAERLAVRNAATLVQAQAAHDNKPERLMSDKAAELTEWAENLTYIANDVLALIGRAERALAAGQIDAARDMLSCASMSLGGSE